MINISGRSLCESCFAEISSEPCPKCGFSEASYIPEQTVLPCGSILQGRYVIGRVIGRGGFGITYLAYDTKLDRKIAVKEYFPRTVACRNSDAATVIVHNENDAETFKKGAEKFYAEARLVAKFNGNPSIVNVFDFFYENSTAYYTMEYLQGQTIKDYVLKNGAMTVDQVKNIAEETASALIAIHGASILHRDVSPDNIMLCSDGKIKLIDFGAARQVIFERVQNFSVILKPGFAPLEQYMKKGRQGPWTDIYSLGTTLFYCLTGKIPEDPMSRLESDDGFAAGLMSADEGLRSIIMKAAALKIEDRYGSAAELMNDLKNGSAAVSQNTSGNMYSGTSTQREDYVPAPPLYSAETSAAEASPVPVSAVPDENVYGEAAAASKKPLIIAAAVSGAAVIVIAAVLILLLSGNKDEDTVIANAETGSTSASAYAADRPDKVVQTAAPPVETTVKTVRTTETSVPEENVKTEKTSAPTTTEPPKTTAKTSQTTVETSKTTTAKAETQPSSDKVQIGKEYYDINTVGVLNLSNKGLEDKDIKNLKYMTKVSEIILSDNKLTDLSPVSELKALKKLTFHNNSVSDISFVNNLKLLTAFNAGNNNITDISPLKNCKSLEELWIFGNNISDVSALSKCKYLEDVGLSDNFITDLTPLANSKLTKLYASNNSLNGNYEALAGLTIYSELRVDGNGYDADPDGFYEFACVEMYSDSDGFNYWI